MGVPDDADAAAGCRGFVGCAAAVFIALVEGPTAGLSPFALISSVFWYAWLAAMRSSLASEEAAAGAVVDILEVNRSLAGGRLRSVESLAAAAVAMLGGG